MADLIPQSAPATSDPADGAQDTSGSYCIEIHVSAQGAIKVSVEPEAEEAQEESGEAGADEESQPVSSIREAVKLVMTIYNSQGELPDTGQDQADMSAGYGKD